MKRRKILFVISSLGRGGAELHCLRVAPMLNPEHYDIAVFLFRMRGAAFEEMPSHVKVFAPWYEMEVENPGLASRLVRMVVSTFQFAVCLLKERPDIVHFFLPSSYLHGGTVALLLGRRNLVMSRRSLNYYMNHRPAWVNRLELLLHGRMKALSGNSNAVIRQLIEEEHAPTDRTQLIYNGVALPELSTQPREAARVALGVPEGEIVMIVVANLFPYKGHADLFEACAQLPLNQPWRLIVLGRDASGIMPALVATADRLGIADKVHMVGEQADVGRYLAAADIGILPSHEEGFSNAILESMAFGLPMVVTDVGGNAEAVLNQETGLVVPAKSPAQLGIAIRRLIEDPEARRMMGAAGRQRVERHFSLRRCVEDYDGMYQNILSSRPLGNA